MDYSRNLSDDNDLWEWNADDYYLRKDSNVETRTSPWAGDQNGQRSYMFEETATPVKACGDLAYNVSNSRKNTNKEAEQYKGYTSQAKRRRVLQFNTQSTDSLLCSENTQYAFESSQEKQDLIEDVNVQWEPGFYEDRSVSGNGELDQSAEAWFSSCFSDGGMHLSSEDMNVSGISDDQIDISEFCNITDEMESDPVQVCPTPSPIRIYRGRKSNLRPPTNLASSVAYPFALIKPCGVHGDVTLKDINQRICGPAPSISTPDKEEVPPVSYPTSAFSGKPVVVKTKIRTEGGKGSITIMRTKG